MIKARKVTLARTVKTARTERVDRLGLLALRVLQVSQVRRVTQVLEEQPVHKAHKVRWALKVMLALRVIKARKVTLVAPRVHKGRKERRVMPAKTVVKLSFRKLLYMFSGGTLVTLRGGIW